MFGFGKRIKLFTLLGFEVYIDLTWIILALLVTWSLAEGLFRTPKWFGELPRQTRWIMGVIGALGLFLSIILHELSHSLVARRYGLPMRGITLFIFGGVAEMTDEPPSPKAEFLMAIAGPISSVLIGGLCGAVWYYAYSTGKSPFLYGVFGYLAFINLLLAAFNMIPAFPLDGGRVLRSALWSWTDNIRWATRIASRLGGLFGFFLIAWGFWVLLQGNFVAGLWWVLIGYFLNNASQMSYRHLITRQALEGERVRRFMKTDPITVSAHTPLNRFVDDYLYRYYFKMFPVVDNSNLIGCIGPRHVKEVPREEWERRTAGEIADRCSGMNVIGPDADAMKALSLMSRTGNSRLLVVENGHLIGILALKDMMRFLSMKLDLEDYDIGE